MILFGRISTFLCVLGIACSPVSAQDGLTAFASEKTETCKLSLRTPADINWRGPFSRGYDAYYANTHSERGSFSVRGVGKDCAYEVQIMPLGDDYTLVGTSDALGFFVSAADGVASSLNGNPLVLTGNLTQPAMGTPLEFMVGIEPGQHVKAGRYTKELELRLLQVSDEGVAVADIRRVGVVAEVWPKVVASIGANAHLGVNTTKVSLGDLRASVERNLDFSVYANHPYKIKIKSENSGNLKHFKSEALVGYRLVLDGDVVDPEALSEAVDVSAGSSSRTHDLRLIVVPADAGAPAGYYQDQLTVTITAG